MSKYQERNRFLDLIFDDGDQVAWGNDRETSNRPMDPYPGWYETNASFFCINPLNEWRLTKNVTKINAMLFEMDKDKKGQVIPAKQQVRMWLESGIPFTTMTYSGNKSVHVIVRFDEPIEDKQWQRQWWRAIHDVLTYTFKMPVDPNTKALPQLSRMPCSVRPDTGEQQKLILTRARVTQREMKDWIEANGFQLKPPKQSDETSVGYYTNGNASELQKYKRAKQFQIKDHGMYSQDWNTGAHNWFLGLGIKFYNEQVDLNVGIGLAEVDFGSQFKGESNGGWVGNTADSITAGYNWASNNN